MNEIINNQVNDINAEEWKQVLNLFDQLSERSSADQQSILNAVSLSEQAKTQLTKMLETLHQPNMLDQTINPLVEALLGAEAVNEHINPTDIIGRTFGAWQTVSTLGSGGMGQVFVAQRADGQFEKQVALKIIKAGYFSALSQQRFLAEMRTLAQFEHPNIAHLIDGGTSDDGIAYFVMELVSGEPILDYASANKLSLTQRVKLILQVIDAVEYAHQSLIIHGDIKPANILVNQSGQVKLVDFGIARPFEDERSDTYLPQFTPSYSSPEQAQGKVLTTASDVFGLCAVLYELCTGSSPRNSESTSTHAIYTKTVNKPITAAYTNFQSNKNITNNYGFGRALSQELGSIIDKGLQIAVANRYKNTTELRRDLLLFLEGSAVPTYADNWFYKWRKSISKHKWPVAISALAALGIVISAMVAIKQARVAEQEAKKANWSSEFLISIFDQADPVKNQQNPITVNELIGVASEQVLNDDSDYAPAVRLNALSLLADIQYKLNQTESASKIHLKQIDLLNRSGDDPSGLVKAHFFLGKDYQQLGLYDQALKHFKIASQIVPIDRKVTHMGVISMQSLVMVHLRFNKIQEAENIMNKLLSLRGEILKADQPFESMSNISMAQVKLEEAKGRFDLALKGIERTKYYFEKIPYDPIFFAEILGVEASLYGDLNRFDLAVEPYQKAIKIFKQHYGQNHTETLIILSNYASLLGQKGDYADSIEAYLEVLKIAENTSMPDFYQAIINQNIAQQYRKSEKCTDAIEYFKKAENLFETIKNPRVMAVINTLTGMGRCYLELDELLLSEGYFSSALQLTQDNYGIGSSSYANNQLMMVPLYLKQNKIAEINAFMPDIYKILTDKYGEKSTQVAGVLLKWAQVYEKQTDYNNVHKMAKQALEIYEKSEPTTKYQKSIEEAKRLIKLNE